MPAAALVCPKLPLTVLITAGVAPIPAAASRAWLNAVSSVASPTAVPVPWPSR